MSCVALCPGHGNREPGRTYDPGATFGKISERDITGRVAAAAVPYIEAAGIDVVVFDGPGYAREHAEMVKKLDAAGGPALYCSLHANIGGGDYAMVRPAYRSKAGARAARAIADAIEDLPEVTSFRTDELYPDGETAAKAGRHQAGGSWEWWTRGWVCIDGLWPAKTAPGVLVELGFLDSPRHAPLWTDEGIARLAERFAAGVVAYLRSAGA